MQEMTYCYLCGNRLTKKHVAVWQCSHCSQHYYANHKPTVELALLSSDNKILLAKRGIEPHKGMYDLPGGFVDIDDETIEAAAIREAKEELGLSEAGYEVPQYFTSFTTTYPYERLVYSLVTMVFTARLIAPAATLKAQDDVAGLKWVDQKGLDPTVLTSEKHYQIITAILQAATKGIL